MKMDGGDEVCHSRVLASHGLSPATSPLRRLTSTFQMKGSVEGVVDHVGLWLTYGTIVGVILFIWILLLNLALFALGRRWRAA